MKLIKIIFSCSLGLFSYYLKILKISIKKKNKTKLGTMSPACDLQTP